MSREERLNLLSERALLQEMLAGLSADGWMSRQGFESRVRDIDEQLAGMPENQPDPVRAILAFGGQPVVDESGMAADSGLKAMGCFVELVAAVGWSLASRAQGHPVWDPSQLLITGVVTEPFGFVMQERASGSLPPDGESLVAMAMTHTQRLLAAVAGDDDALTGVVSEASPYVIEKLRVFLSALVESGAVATLEYENRHTGFEDVAQVNRSLKCLMDLQTPGQGSAVPLKARLSA